MMKQKWVVLYGYGTRSAYADAVHTTRRRAELALDIRRQTWGNNGKRFSIHPYDAVVDHETKDELVLRPSTQVAPPEPPVAPIVAPPHPRRPGATHSYKTRDRNRNR